MARRGPRFPTGPGKAPKLREEAVHGDFVAMMKDALSFGAAAVRAVQQANTKALESLVQGEARREGRDLAKWQFNADTMRWQERPAQGD